MHIKTKDFQILKGEHEFDFPVGLTIIQGRNASGKSSLFQAIKYALVNKAGTDLCINHQSKQAEVTIENNGSSVTWIKSKGTSEYIDNTTGQTYVKASKMDSRDIANLGFLFDMDDKVINLFGMHDVMFPYGYKSTELYELFQEIFSVTCGSQIIDLFKKDEQTTKTAISDKTKTINDLKQKGLNISEILQNVDEEIIDNYINKLKQQEDNLSKLQIDYSNYSRIYGYKQITLPEQFNPQKINDKSVYYNQLLLDYEKYNKSYNLIQQDLPDEGKGFDLKENPYLADYNKLVSLYKDIETYTQEIEAWQLQYKRIEEKLKEIKVCPTCGRPLEDCNEIR